VLDSITLMRKIAEEKSSANSTSWLSVFTAFSWLATLILAILIAVSSRVATLKEYHWFLLPKCLLLQPPETKMGENSMRIILFTSALTGLMLNVIYCGELTSRLSVATLEKPIKTLDDVADNDLIACEGGVPNSILAFAKENTPAFRAFRRGLAFLKCGNGQIVQKLLENPNAVYFGTSWMAHGRDDIEVINPNYSEN